MGALRLPMASLRLAVAIRYWHSARIVMGQQSRDMEFMEPVGHLLSMAAELSLKAYLLERGMTDRELGKLRIHHDLGAILRLCIQRGLKLGEEEVEMILVLRAAHLEHFHRYGPKSLAGCYTILLPNETMALGLLARVLDRVSADPDDLRRRHSTAGDFDWPLTDQVANPVTITAFDRTAAAVEEHARQIAAIGAPHARL